MTILIDSRPTNLNPANRLKAIAKSFFEMVEVSHQRKQLAKMNAERLSDIGLTASAQRNEVSKPAWDVPCHWLRKS
jgi:uncharacterized protein YjiS (DUF1127 family)